MCVFSHYQSLNAGVFPSYLFPMLFILFYDFHSILLFTHDYPSACLGDVPCVVRNVLFAATSFHRQSIFVRAFYEPFGSFKLAPARHFRCEKKRKLGMFWCISSNGDLVSWIVFQLEVNAKCYLTFATCHASLCSKIIWDHAAMKLRTRSVLFKTSLYPNVLSEHGDAGSVACKQETSWFIKKDEILKHQCQERSFVWLLSSFLRIVHFWVCSSCVVMTSWECAQRSQYFSHYLLEDFIIKPSKIGCIHSWCKWPKFPILSGSGTFSYWVRIPSSCPTTPRCL